MSKNILIYCPFGIGDVLFSTALIKALSEGLPSSKINYICNERAYHILKNNRRLDNIIIYEKDIFRNLWKRSKLNFLKELALFLKKIRDLRSDILIDLSLNYQAGLIGMILGIPKRIGFDYKKRKKFLTDKLDLAGYEKKHVVSHLLDILKLLDLHRPDDVSMEIVCSDENNKWADNFLIENNLCGKCILGVMPGGGKSWGPDARYRRWPVSNFAHVADKIIDNFDIPIILFGDDEEAGLCGNMFSFMHDHNKVINMGGKTEVGRLMALIKKCSFILCNEGGPLHISVSLDVPTVSIFGPVDEVIYGPFSKELGSKHIIISERTKCGPCYTRFKHKKCDNLICLNSISEDRVYGELKKLIGRTIKKEEIKL